MLSRCSKSNATEDKKGYIDTEGTESSTDEAPSKIITKKEIAPEKIIPKEIEEIKTIEVTASFQPVAGKNKQQHLFIHLTIIL